MLSTPRYMEKKFKNTNAKTNTKKHYSFFYLKKAI